VPHSYCEGTKKPKEFVITSKTKEFYRFHTETIERLLYGLRTVEKEAEKQLIPFIFSLVSQLFKQRDKIFKAISCIAEIDVYCSFAKCATKMDYYCRPKLYAEAGIFSLKSMIHPCLHKMGY
jgi:DNA mismatch repair ATPase MutS